MLVQVIYDSQSSACWMVVAWSSGVRALVPGVPSPTNSLACACVSSIAAHGEAVGCRVEKKSAAAWRGLDRTNSVCVQATRVAAGRDSQCSATQDYGLAKQLAPAVPDGLGRHGSVRRADTCAFGVRLHGKTRSSD